MTKESLHFKRGMQPGEQGLERQFYPERRQI